MKPRLKQGSRVAIAALVALSFVAGSGLLTGVASAGDYQKTWTNADDVRWLGFDSANMSSGTVEVEISTTDGPGGEQIVLYRENHTVAELQDGNSVNMFENAGAYENVTISVSGAPSEPEWGVGSEFQTVQWRQRNELTSSGGDRDLICNTGERLAMSINPAIDIADCRALPGATNVNTTDLDANETKLEIYQSAQDQEIGEETYHSMISNRLEDSASVALIKGKNAYIRSLNLGESKNGAESRAVENVTRFYSRMEYNLIQRWNAQIAHAEYLQSVAENETGLSRGFIDLYVEKYHGTTINHATVDAYQTGTYTLNNGTTVETYEYLANVSVTEDSSGNEYNDTRWIGPGETPRILYDKVEILGIEVAPPDDQYSAIAPVTNEDYNRSLYDIGLQTDAVTSQMRTLADATYDDYSRGQINNSELIDPYVLQSEYSPGSEYEGWAAAQLALLGTNQPTDLDSTGYMEIAVEDGSPDGLTYEGILHSDENPPSGEFQTGVTYDPDNIGGVQYVVTDDGIRNISRNFTITNVTTQDGESRESFEITEKNYNVTNTAELDDLYEELGVLRAEIEAREDWRNNQNGGGLALGGLPAQAQSAWENASPAEKAGATAGAAGGGALLIGRILSG